MQRISVELALGNALTRRPVRGALRSMAPAVSRVTAAIALALLLHMSPSVAAAGDEIAASDPAVATPEAAPTTGDSETPVAAPSPAPGCMDGKPGSCCGACQTRARMVEEGKIKADGEWTCPCQRAKAAREAAGGGTP